MKLRVVMDLARGVAALTVCLFHYRKPLGNTIPFIEELFKYGHYGVPLFFVISGYVITSSSLRIIQYQKGSLEFLRRRLLRIYPPFIASVVVIAALPFLLEGISSIASGRYVAPQPHWISWSVSDWIQLVTLTREAFGNSYDPVNGVYWSLAIELQFYLIVYIAVTFRRRYALILASISVIGFVCLLTPGVPYLAGFFLVYWPMFAAGIVLKAAEHYFPRNLLGIAASKSIFAVLSIACTLLYFVTPRLLESTGLRTEVSYFLFSCVCLLIFLLAMPLEVEISRLLSRQRISVIGSVLKWVVVVGVFFGEISYSLYLLHAQTSNLAGMITRRALSISSMLYWPVVILLIVGFSRLFHKYAERPFMSEQNIKAFRIKAEKSPAPELAR